ncbi:MAG TPA: hypothetical protein DDY29_05345 [Rhodobacteraceae bacterium]|jgi:hypothetical protein|nr:hypothetical protein [Paracoccaceae bacterium]HBG98160.1 hypothetical protein [Paracoccaceae bacterium]
MPPRRRTPARLLHSVLILAPLIPGGPIETRILAEYPIWAIASFNLVISVIVLAALPLAWIGRRGGRRVAIGSVLDGAGFTAIYALDMLKIFPVSETPMSPTLRVMAFAGLATGLAVVASALADLAQQPPDRAGAPAIPRKVVWLLVALALGLIVAAVVYGTIGAVG